MRKLKPSKKLNQLKKHTEVKISVCYIVKNEEKNLPKSIESVKDQVDEIVVVDTGSTDNTMEIAKSYGAKIFESAWNNDFSTPRNIAIDNATGNWIIFLDADEYFTKETKDNIRAIVKHADKNNKEGLLINLVNIDVDKDNKILDTTYLLRIYKKVDNCHYVGRIHEELQKANGETFTNISLVPTKFLEIYHTGYSENVNADKAKRNLKMLLAELELTDQPERIYGYIAQCYNGLTDIENAEKYAIMDIEGGRRETTFASSSYRILLHILAKDPKRIEERIKYVIRATKDFPETPEFSAELAECYAFQGNYPKAIVEMEIALKKFASYNSLEPMFFNQETVNLCNKHLGIWRSKVNEKNQSY